MPEYVEREAAIVEFEPEKCYSFNEIKAILESVPAADVALVVHAHWIKKYSPWIKNSWICSNCREVAETTKRKLNCCPNCWAVMDEVEAGSIKRIEITSND